MTRASQTFKVYKHSVYKNLQLRLPLVQVRILFVKTMIELITWIIKNIYSKKQFGYVDVEVCFTVVFSSLS